MDNEKNYLQKLYDELDKLLIELEELDPYSENFVTEVDSRIKQLVDFEAKKRQDCEIGVRFSVIKNLIQGINQHLKEVIKQREIEAPDEDDKDDNENEGRDVYVYLFNILGRKLSSWYHLFSQQALMEHSVNRPIYGRREHIDELLRSKDSLEQHAYIVVSVDPEDITMDMTDSVLKDNLGNPLMRVRQGSLRVENVKYFHHMERDYKLTDEGTLVAYEA